MRLETIVYVSVLTGPARTPDGVMEFTAVLRRQMALLDITGSFTTCDNLGVHVARAGPPLSIGSWALSKPDSGNPKRACLSG
jgi:hypothetical protein